MTIEQQAQELAKELVCANNPVLWHRYNGCPNEVAIILKAFHAQRQAVWEEAAKFVEDGWEDGYGQPIHGVQGIADAMRQQATREASDALDE